MKSLPFDLQRIKSEVEKADKYALQSEKISSFQKEMKKEGIDGVICFKPQNTFLFSSFTPILYSHPVVIIIPSVGDVTLLVHALRLPHAMDEAAINDIQVYSFWGEVKGISEDVYSAIGIIAKEKGLIGKRIGYEGDFLPIYQYEKINELLNPTQLVDIQSMIKKFSMKKNDYECNLMRMSSWLTMMGMRATIEEIRKSEAQSSMAGEIAMREAWIKELGDYEVSGFGNVEGGIPTALWCYANSGYRVAYGCECPNNRIPKDGEVSLPIIWAAVNGYHAEMERTIIIGNLDQEHQLAFEAMLEARENIFKVLKPGITVGEVYSAAINSYVKYGLEKYAPGRVGHGLGLSIHDAPSMDKGSDIILEEGMIFTVEPSFNFNNWGSIRHSDTVLITETGYENLTDDKEVGYRIIR